MKQLFDLVATQPVGNSKFHGGGEYSKAVFEGAVKAGYSFDALYDRGRYLDPHIKSFCGEFEIPLIDRNGRSFSEASRGYDTFFTGMPYGKFRDWSNETTRVIFTIHGIRSLEMPSDKLEIPFYRSNAEYKRILKSLFIRLFPSSYEKIARDNIKHLLNLPNKQIITVSNHTKYSLLSQFPTLKEDELSVCYSPLYTPASPEETQISEVLERFSLEADGFYLGLGSGRWLKNNLRLAMAFDQLCSAGKLKGRRLIITGGKHSLYKNLKNKESFLFLDYVENEELEVLFKTARGLLYPSLNEGFGYPPLQAMKYGTAVLASAFSSVPEVCGDAVVYANPYSIAELKNRILMLENQQIRETLIQKGPARFELIQTKQDAMLQDLLRQIFSD